MRMKRLIATLAPVLCLALSLPAAAAAPQPRAAFDRAHMTGRWYEIARTPNAINKDCQGSATDWAPKADGGFRITAICRKGSPTGPARTVTGEVVVLNPGQNNRVKMKLFAGLVSREYWIFDHADDYAWLIMGTPKGDFISIEATRPTLPGAVKAEALARARALGYDTSKLVFPSQSGR
jgi:apolipoprotein D and lipocalin family protein